MKELLVENLDKIIPAVQSACGKIGDNLGDVLNDAIDKVVDSLF